MKTYYFTFGCGQPHENGYHIITAADWLDARSKMIHRFGWKWCGQYSDDDEECASWSKDGLTQAEEYNLFEVL